MAVAPVSEMILRPKISHGRSWRPMINIEGEECLSLLASLIWIQASPMSAWHAAEAQG